MSPGYILEIDIENALLSTFYMQKAESHFMFTRCIKKQHITVRNTLIINIIRATSKGGIWHTGVFMGESVKNKNTECCVLRQKRLASKNASHKSLMMRRKSASQRDVIKNDD